MLIVLDSDFLMKISNDPLPKFRVKEFSLENDFLIIPQVLREIEGLTRSRTLTTARRARQTVRVIQETKLFRLVEATRDRKDETSKWNKKDADNLLVEYVKERPTERMLATLDGSLLSRATRLGLPYLTLRNGRAFFSTKMRATYLTPTKESHS